MQTYLGTEMHNALGTALLPESVAAPESHLFATVANVTEARVHATKKDP